MRKKNIKKSIEEFISSVDELENFLSTVTPSLSDKHQSWCHDYAIIRLYREFEGMMLSVIVGIINRDTSVLSNGRNGAGIKFPKHLNNKVCEYLVTGGEFFNFNGRDGLIKELGKYLPKEHRLIEIVKNPQYTNELRRLCSLRNYAAHDSQQSKKKALEAVGQERMGDAGAWLKKKGRFSEIAQTLKQLAQEIYEWTPS